jgi:hypothetical protein
MQASWSGIVELLFVFGIALAWGIYELHAVRKSDPKQDEDEGASK